MISPHMLPFLLTLPVLIVVKSTQKNKRFRQKNIRNILMQLLPIHSDQHEMVKYPVVVPTGSKDEVRSAFHTVDAIMPYQIYFHFVDGIVTHHEGRRLARHSPQIDLRVNPQVIKLKKSYR